MCKNEKEKGEATWKYKRRNLERDHEFASRAVFAVYHERKAGFQRSWEECIPGREKSA